MEMAESKYHRVLLKLSGESFCKPGQFGIDGPALESIAERIAAEGTATSHAAAIVIIRTQ